MRIGPPPDDHVEAFRMFLRVRGKPDGPASHPRIFRQMRLHPEWRRWLGLSPLDGSMYCSSCGATSSPPEGFSDLRAPGPNGTDYLLCTTCTARITRGFRR